MKEKMNICHLKIHIWLYVYRCWPFLQFYFLGFELVLVGFGISSLGLGSGLDLDSCLRIEPNKLHGLQTGQELDLEVWHGF